MNPQEKERAQKFIVQNIEGITAAIKAAVTAKDEYRKEVNRLTLEGKEYTPEYKERQLQDLKNRITVRMQNVSVDMGKRLDELKMLLQERDSVLDLNNPALPAALLLIQSIGGAMTFDQAIKINANFIHDQSALTAMAAAYQAQNKENAGNIQALRYNTEDVINNLKTLAYRAFMQEGSINTFAFELSKFAKLEGTTTEALPDQQSAVDSMRYAAGLPVA
ncbi:MAG: hypothetical protein WCK35_19185 [Chloroflexota bacterium]